MYYKPRSVTANIDNYLNAKDSWSADDIKDLLISAKEKIEALQTDYNAAYYKGKAEGMEAVIEMLTD